MASSGQSKSMAEVLALLRAAKEGGLAIVPKAQPAFNIVRPVPLVPVGLIVEPLPEGQQDNSKTELVIGLLPKVWDGEFQEFREYLNDPFTRTALAGGYDTFNPKQLACIAAIALGFSLNIIGSAGVGKTTAVRVGASERLRLLKGGGGLEGTSYRVCACAYTRQATGVLRSKMGEGVEVLTLHKLLAYAPTEVERYDEASGTTKVTRPFLPRFNKDNPLPPAVKTVIVDEASMLGKGILEKALFAALPNDRVQIVYVGDYGQLEPVLDRSALMFALDSERPTIELDFIYRTQEGPVLDIAYACRNGAVSELQDKALRALSDKFPDEFIFRLNLIDGKPHRTLLGALHRTVGYITNALESGDLDMERGDMVLCPHNENFGVKELNRAIAEFYDKRDGRKVYEIIAGYIKHYLAVGDKIRVMNESVFVVKIVGNMSYSGKSPQDASRWIDRQGHRRSDSPEADLAQAHSLAEDSVFNFDMDFAEVRPDDLTLDEANKQVAEMMARAQDVLEGGGDLEVGRKNQASHRVYYRYPDQPPELDFEDQYIDTAAEFNAEQAGILNYASTVHKAQGSEGPHVLIALHSSHASTLRRETLYTAITRARKKVTILTTPDLVHKAGFRSSFPGLDWQAKARNYVMKCELDDARNGKK